MNFFLYFMYMWFAYSEMEVIAGNVGIDDYLIRKFALLDGQVAIPKKYDAVVEYDHIGNITESYDNLDLHVKFIQGDNYTLLLSGKNLSRIDFKAQLSLRHIGYLDKIDNDLIKFTVTSDFPKTNYILVRMENGIAHIFEFSTEMNYVHSLLIPSSVDATFFKYKEDVYLIVVNNEGVHLAEIITYKWTGTHFDEVETVFTKGAVKVTSFTTEKYAVIIVFRSMDTQKVYSDVYEFKGHLRKIHYIPTEDPIYADTFVVGNERALIVYEKSKNNSLFHWTGSYFMEISRFHTLEEVHLSTVIPTQDFPILVIPQQTGLGIYKIYSDSAKFLNQIPYTENYTNMLDINTLGMNGTLTIVTAGADGFHKMLIGFISLTVDADNTDGDKDLSTIDDLHKCYNNLESGVYELIRSMKEDQRPTVILAESLTQDLDQTLNLTDKIEKVKNQTAAINETITNYNIENDTLTINGDVLFEGQVKAAIVNGRDVVITKINEFKWIPEDYLRYKEPQIVTGPVSISSIVVNDLVVPDSDGFFKDPLLRSGNKILSMPVKILNLTVNHLEAQRINDVDIASLYNRKTGTAVGGVKVFRELNANRTNANIINDKKDHQDAISNLVSNPDEIISNNVFINNLEVETIDGVNWTNLINSVFWKPRDDSINGSLRFANLNVQNMTVDTLNGISMADYLTTSTVQNISSNIEFNRIYAKNIFADQVNGLQLENVSVPFDSNVTINGPVNFVKVAVTENLALVGNFNESFFVNNGDHILGTNKSDLFQRYKGPVKIKGDLILNNLKLSQNARLVLSGKDIDPDISKIYWTKNTNQVIPTHVTMQKGLSAPHIITEQLNGVNFHQYMTNNSDNKLETDFEFEKVTVLGNVVLNKDKKNSPDINLLMQEAVLTNGTFQIKGKKIYHTLKAENLMTNELCGINTLNVLNTKWMTNVTGTKMFKNLTVNGNIVADTVEIQKINDVNVTNFLGQVVYIDEPQNISKLNFTSLSVLNLNVTKVNGKDISTYEAKLEEMKSVERIKNLTVTGNISIDNLKNVSTVNGVSWKDLKERQSGVITGSVRYHGKVRIDNLRTKYINSINLRRIVKRLLYKDIDQTITAPYTFKNIQTRNFVTPKINNISLEKLIDISSELPQDVYVSKSVKFTEIDVIGSLVAKNISPCQIDKLVDVINDPMNRSWSKVLVKGNVTVLDEESVLYRLAEKMVNKNRKNTITAPVNFSKNILVQDTVMKKGINNIHLADILKDAVLSNSDNLQVIHGQKWFTTLHAINAEVIGNSDIFNINSENIKQLNKDIVHKNDQNVYEVKGKKTFFGGLQCERYHGPLMKGWELDKIVQLKSERAVPRSIFDTLEVENNLEIGQLNNMNFNDFLQNRLLTDLKEQKTNAVYFFNNTKIANITTPHINDFKISDVVFDTKETVNIIGPKFFTKNLTVQGNITVDLFNSLNISEEYKKSILHGNNTHIQANVTLLAPIEFHGVVETNSINSFPISDIEHILHKTDTRSAIQKMSLQEEEIISQVRKNLKKARELPSNYMYLEKSDVLQISVKNIITASTVSSNGYVLIHMIGEKAGNYCGLADSCKCPSQYSMEISPEHSVAVFTNEGHNRVFSYDDGSMIVHLITDSVSTNSTCRKASTKAVNEISLLNWNLRTHDTRNGDVLFHYDRPINGYVSKAEFFTIKEQAYAVIARYYDPVLDTHHLDTTILKFVNNKTKALEIQKIQTYAASEVHLFDTAQGLVLVIGNVKYLEDYSHENEETLIYRFNEEKEQFIFMRKIPYYGCMAARGISIGLDSSIVLAHHYFPIQIVKYNPEFDNYMYEQSFDEIDEPILSISTFYEGMRGDAHLTVVTRLERFYIYTFKFIEGWKQEAQGFIDGLKDLIPFVLSRQQYLFAPSSNTSSLLTIVTNGNN